MYLGKIVEIGESDELFRNPVHPYTRALIAASPIPDPELERKEARILQGEIGSNVNPPEGCRFHPRCPYATERCRMEEPKLEQNGNRKVACHFAKEFMK